MKRICSLACALLLCLALLPVRASADMGPKPELTILVKNAPDGLYYLDLLLPEETRGSYDNLHGKPYDQALLAGLHVWEGEGWYPAFAGGTRAPLFGDLTPDANGAHRFTYHGLPKTFRIAVSTAEGSQATEESFTRTAFYTNLVYDCQTNSVTRATSGWLARLIQLLATLIPTLIVEGIVLLLFGFRLRENALVFLLVNLATQLGLHLVIGSGFVTLASSFPFYLLVLLPAEAVIFAVEAVAYAFLLKGGHTRGRRVLYALAANAASFAAGFFSLQPVLSLLKQL